MSDTPILYEDADLIAVDKPVGLASIPERDLSEPSVQRLLEAARGERLFVVHRLDKEVSGLLLFARTATAHRMASLAFERREVGKHYLAIAHGWIDGLSGLIDAPIHQFGSGRMGVDPRGKASRTRWHRLAEASASAPAGRPTLLDLEPLTGRRHQLRVHAYHVGHPLIGDLRYGDRALQQTYPRLALHAWRLALETPRGPLTLQANPPPAFHALAASLGLALP
jgi:RluA family pseudouridine synthase